MRFFNAHFIMQSTDRLDKKRTPGSTNYRRTNGGRLRLSGTQRQYPTRRTAMKVVFSKGFPIPKTRYAGIEDIEALEQEAQQKSVVVQGVRNVRMVDGQLTLEFHDHGKACVAVTETGWKGVAENTVSAPLRYRDGVHAAVVIGSYAYSDYEIKTR